MLRNRQNHKPSLYKKHSSLWSHSSLPSLRETSNILPRPVTPIRERLQWVGIWRRIFADLLVGRHFDNICAHAQSRLQLGGTCEVTWRSLLVVLLIQHLHCHLLSFLSSTFLLLFVLQTLSPSRQTLHLLSSLSFHTIPFSEASLIITWHRYLGYPHSLTPCPLFSVWSPEEIKSNP